MWVKSLKINSKLCTPKTKTTSTTANSSQKLKKNWMKSELKSEIQRTDRPKRTQRRDRSDKHEIRTRRRSNTQYLFQKNA